MPLILIFSALPSGRIILGKVACTHSWITLLGGSRRPFSRSKMILNRRSQPFDRLRARRQETEKWRTGIMEWWSIAKYRAPSTKSQGVRGRKA
jgi:hypothetical protein